MEQLSSSLLGHSLDFYKCIQEKTDIEHIGLIGTTYGLLTIVSSPEKKILPCGRKRDFVDVKCECGMQKSMQLSVVKRAKTCGCLRIQNVRKLQFHGIHCSTARTSIEYGVAW
jgi:hypothetical protein